MNATSTGTNPAAYPRSGAGSYATTGATTCANSAAAGG